MTGEPDELDFEMEVIGWGENDLGDKRTQEEFFLVIGEFGPEGG